MDGMLNKILEGDCCKLLKSLPDDCVDLVFCDSPFNLDKNYNSYEDKLSEKQYLNWCQTWIDECYRVLRPGGSIFLHNIPKWLIKYCCMMEDLFDFKHWISWDAPTSPMGNSLQPAHYGILYHTKGKDYTFREIRKEHKRCRECKVLEKDYGGKKHTIPCSGPLVSDVWNDIHRLKHAKYRNNHPCQLPVTLVERIILMSSEVGNVVLDPFMGAGTTAVAAKRLDRNFLGFEIDPEYVRIGTKRVERQDVSSKLNDIYVSCFNKQIVTVRHDDVHSGNEYSKEWIDLWENWADTSEKRVSLNKEKMRLKKEHQDKVDYLCEKLREN